MTGNIIAFESVSSWEEAVEKSNSYSSEKIVSMVRRSASMVKTGQAVYERDGVLFEKIQYSFPLLSSLLFVAANCQGLRVIDFGGALGTTFQQNRQFLSNLDIKYDWRVVDLPVVVEIGREEFSTDFLSFYNSIAEATKEGVDVVIFGASICYVPDPYKVMQDAVNSGATHIIFDRTPINNFEEDTFAVQRVPPSIYEASYPIRNFSKRNLIRIFENSFFLVEQWVCDGQPDPQNVRIGFVLKRTKDRVLGQP